jgi:hypothetical protein
LSWKNYAKAGGGIIAWYIGWQLLDYVESLVHGMLQGSFPIPSETVIYGAIGIVVIILGSILLLASSPNLWQSFKSSILPLVFEGKIFGEKENKFLVGGTLCFKAQYRGNLKNGYFTTKIRPQELNTILDTGREYEWLPDYNTNIRRPEDPNKESGTLNGRGSGWLRKSHSSTWAHKIAFRYPPGKYTATLMVLDDTSPSVPLAFIPLTFTVLDEELHPMRGWTSQGKEIPAPRSMFVRKPRKRNWLGALR